MNSYLTRLDSEIAATIAGITPDQLVRPCNGKWTILEILEHLLLTYSGTAKGFQRSLSAGQVRVTRPSLYQRVATFAVVGLRYFPEGRKSQPQAQPGRMSAEQVMAQIRPQIAEMDSLASECESRFGNVRILDHPILGALTVSQWRKFHLAHGHHHCQQIGRTNNQG
jgi:hypothetical protein